MKQLLQKLKAGKVTRRTRTARVGGSEWMKKQLLRMTELNQGLVRMSGGR